jgi:hypothetical protein
MFQRPEPRDSMADTGSHGKSKMSGLEGPRSDLETTKVRIGEKQGQRGMR